MSTFTFCKKKKKKKKKRSVACIFNGIKTAPSHLRSPVQYTETGNTSLVYQLEIIMAVPSDQGVRDKHGPISSWLREYYFSCTGMHFWWLHCEHLPSVSPYHDCAPPIRPPFSFLFKSFFFTYVILHWSYSYHSNNMYQQLAPVEIFVKQQETHKQTRNIYTRTHAHSPPPPPTHTSRDLC